MKIEPLPEAFVSFLNHWFSDVSVERLIDNYLRNIESSGSQLNSEKTIASKIREDGFFIIPALIPEELLQKVNQEFDKGMALDDSFYSGVDRYNGAKCLRVKPFWKLKYWRQFPVTYSIFGAKILARIARNFYETSRFRFITEAFFHRTPGSPEVLSQQFHWDRNQSLKIWIYLNDVNESNGATRVIPGSNKVNRKIRLSLGDHRKLAGGVDNLSTQFGIDPDWVHLSAPRGSIVFLDTDLSHAASAVGRGEERRIIRAHCRLG